MGFLNVFMFFNTQDGPTKYHSFLYYLVTLIELCLNLLFTKDTILEKFGSAPIWIRLGSELFLEYLGFYSGFGLNLKYRFLNSKNLQFLCSNEIRSRTRDILKKRTL